MGTSGLTQQEIDVFVLRFTAVASPGLGVLGSSPENLLFGPGLPEPPSDTKAEGGLLISRLHECNTVATPRPIRGELREFSVFIGCIQPMKST